MGCSIQHSFFTLVSTSPIIESFSKTKNHVPYIPPPTEIEQPVTMETTNQKLPPHLMTLQMNKRRSLEKSICHLEKKGILSQPVVMRILFVHELLECNFQSDHLEVQQQ